MSTIADSLLSLSDYYLPIYRQLPLVLERGQGARVWDQQDNEYIDFAAGIAVCGLGHNHPELKAALFAQAEKLWHTSNWYYSAPPLQLAQELVTASAFAQRVFLCNSGAEANEAAIKLIRRWASSQGRSPQQRVIVSFEGSFHGRTLATMTATAQPKYQQGFEPLPEGFCYSCFNDVAQLESVMSQGNITAVLLEPVQGEGGVMPVSAEFMQRARQLCDQHNALLVLDEIQAGMSRTGKLFAHWHWGIKPDIVTLAKALGGGFPIGALLAGEKVAQVMNAGDHGTTFGGNPLAAAVARVALRLLSSDEIQANVARQSLALGQGLESINAQFGLFEQVRGMGLMLGAVLKPEYAPYISALLEQATQQRLLLLQAGTHVIRFVPPLTITDEELTEGLQRLRAAIAQFMACL